MNMKSKFKTICAILFIIIIARTVSSLSYYTIPMVVVSNENNIVELETPNGDIYVWEGVFNKNVGDIISVTFHDNETVSHYDDFIVGIEN